MIITNCIVSRIQKYTFSAIVTIFIFASTAVSQDDPFEVDKYEFVDYQNNKIVCYDTAAYNLLFEQFTEIGFRGEGKVRILHIGDSHLQADFLSGNFRRRLQTFFMGAIGGRGFVFPYKVAKTNNPLNYKVQSKGTWQGCRNVEKNKSCTLGIAGISVTTTDTNATISVSINDPKLPGYDFDKLMVFHEFGSKFYLPKVINEVPVSVSENRDLGYTLFEFKKHLNSVVLKPSSTDSIGKQFVLYGLNFDSSDPGIIYHTMGVNGAQYESYLRCQKFEPQLKALNPDWIIISLGTNDAYTTNFDTLKFKTEVEETVGMLKRVMPHSAILLTTPSDHRIKRETINKNVLVASDIIKKVAQKQKISYWDFFSVMGGSGSVDYWRYYSMAHTDFLHFTQKGYVYQSKLFFNAFLKAYDKYLTEHFLLNE